jgi:hypothetical protein
VGSRRLTAKVLFGPRRGDSELALALEVGQGRGGRRVAVGVVVLVLVIAGALVAAVELGGGGSEKQSFNVVRVYEDRVDAPSGMAYYLLEVNASNSGPAAWHFDPSSLTVSSNASTAFSSTSGYNVTGLMREADIASGGHLVGEVAFEMPADQAPSRLSYADSKGGMELRAADVPVVSGVASKFNYNANLSVSGTGPVVQGNGWGFGSLLMNGVILNDTLTFFTGQTIQVNLWFEYLKRPADPTTITIQSVAASGGFQITNVDQPVPFTMTGWGSQAGLVLLLKVPPGQQTGSIDLSVLVSA